MNVIDFCSGAGGSNFSPSQYLDSAHARPFRGGAAQQAPKPATPTPPASTQQTTMTKVKEAVTETVSSIVTTVASQPVTKSVSTSLKTLVKSPLSLTKKDIAIIATLSTASALALASLTGLIGPECCSWSSSNQGGYFWESKSTSWFG